MANGSIFAIGGLDRFGLTSVVEQLDERDKKWKQVQSMIAPRCSHAAVSYNDLVYVIGGQSKQSKAQNTVEVFDQNKK